MPNFSDIGNATINYKESLFKKFSAQPNSLVFAIVLGKDGEGGQGSWMRVYYELAELAEDEDWTYQERGDYGVLKHYLNEVFRRAQYQNKIAYSEDGEYACFNTRLQTSKGKDIFLLFRRSASDHPNPIEWVYDSVIDSYSAELRRFSTVPEFPTFIESSEHLVFNYDYDFEMNTEHIIDDNRERLPAVLQENPMMAERTLDGVLLALKEKVRRNYRIAVPHWHRNKIQLLLPLDLGDGNIESVFVLERDDEMRLYRVKTILPVMGGYSNARVLRRMDEDWLKPFTGD